MDTPGMMLKRERQARGLTIKYIAAETKISESALVAIEENDFDSFSAEVFVRGFLRNYARALNVSASAVIGAYEAFKGQLSQQEDAETLTQTRENFVAYAPKAPAVEAANNDEAPATGSRFRFAYLAVVLIAVASIGLSIAFTGTGEAEESDGYYQEAVQDDSEAPFIMSNTSDGWVIQ